MSVQEWSLLIGVLMSCLLTFGPWIIMVHAKLAVIANQIKTLCGKVDQASDVSQKLWTFYAQHEAKLETHDVQIAHVDERLRDL